MKIEINKQWKEEIAKDIEKKEKEVEEMRNEFLEGNCGDYTLSGRIEYYEKEIWYLKGQLSTINLIEKGCFVEVVNEGVEAYV